MDLELYKLHIMVQGRVQGVGFRYFTQDSAKQIGILGWTRNTPDGMVEIEGYGTKRLLEQFLNKIKQGPSASRVTNTTEKWELTSDIDYSDFSIKL